jgi:type II secretory pathway pseudopilin PulG
VVIAIIGILSSVVLASLNTARSKGNDAKVKAQLSGARAAAEIYYDNQNPSGYGPVTALCTAGMFIDPTSGSGMISYTTAANYPGGTTIVCGSTATAYAIKATLGGNTAGPAYHCVDSLGNSRSYTTGWTTTSITACP